MSEDIVKLEIKSRERIAHEMRESDGVSRGTKVTLTIELDLPFVDTLPDYMLKKVLEEQYVDFVAYGHALKAADWRRVAKKQRELGAESPLVDAFVERHESWVDICKNAVWSFKRSIWSSEETKPRE